MTDKDRGSKPQPNEILPADEDLEENGDFVGADEEFEEEPQAAAAAPATGGRTGRTEAAHRPLGSVREGHERVHIDDRLSAAFALICAIILVGVLFLPFLGGIVPKAAAPTLAPLVVPTFNATPIPAATPTLAPSATAS
jgi:hypothetical protein